jgi:hypothetical protein
MKATAMIALIPFDTPRGLFPLVSPTNPESDNGRGDSERISILEEGD